MREFNCVLRHTSCQWKKGEPSHPARVRERLFPRIRLTFRVRKHWISLSCKNDDIVILICLYLSKFIPAQTEVSFFQWWWVPWRIPAWYAPRIRCLRQSEAGLTAAWFDKHTTGAVGGTVMFLDISAMAVSILCFNIQWSFPNIFAS